MVEVKYPSKLVLNNRSVLCSYYWICEQYENPPLNKNIEKHNLPHILRKDLCSAPELKINKCIMINIINNLKHNTICAPDMRFQNKTKQCMHITSVISLKPPLAIHAGKFSAAYIIQFYRTRFIINLHGRTFSLQSWRSCPEGQQKLVSMLKYFLF